MKLFFTVVGKTNQAAIQELMNEYAKRLKKYGHFEVKFIPDLKNTKNLSQSEVKEREGKLLLAEWKAGDHIILLDENGKSMSSRQFSERIQAFQMMNIKQLHFVCGGAYGFSEAVYQRANGKIALSKMTFSHQLVRAIFLEQLYRAFSILNHEPYHHD